MDLGKGLYVERDQTKYQKHSFVNTLPDGT